MNITNTMSTELIVKAMKEGNYSIEELSKKVKLPSLSSCLNEILGKKNISIEALAGLADMNKATVYKIIGNKMNPSRNTLLRLALTLQMSYEETQILLKSGNCASLSGHRTRDLYLIDGIQKKRSIDEINADLTAHNLLDLYSKG